MTRNGYLFLFATESVNMNFRVPDFKRLPIPLQDFNPYFTPLWVDCLKRIKYCVS